MSNKMAELKIMELKNMFFYTFGIVPLQNYNVIGDGISDNRLQIQQAIYDAIEVGAKDIFVPKGEYYYSQTLNKVEEVIFIGNNTQAIIGGVEIRQFPDLWNEAQATSSSLVPIGGTVLYAGKTIPTNYLECNGQLVNISDYKRLYEIINNTEVTEDTTETTFAVPNINSNSSSLKYIIRAK